MRLSRICNYDFLADQIGPLIDLGDLGDVTIGGGALNDILQIDGTGNWVNSQVLNLTGNASTASIVGGTTLRIHAGSIGQLDLNADGTIDMGTGTLTNTGGNISVYQNANIFTNLTVAGLYSQSNLTLTTILGSVSYSSIGNNAVTTNYSGLNGTGTFLWDSFSDRFQFEDHVLMDRNLDVTGAITASGDITTSGGDINVTSGAIFLPATTSDGAGPPDGGGVGIIYQATNRLLHTFGTTNLFLGSLAGNFDVTGANNVALGANAAKTLVAGYNNMCIGASAGRDIEGGYSNVLVGTAAGLQIIGGHDNVALGASCLGALKAGNYNIAIGGTNLNLATGSYNVAIGFQSGQRVTSGPGNTLIGFKAGNNLLTNGYCINIGYRSGIYNTAANKLIIDNQDRANAAGELSYSIIHGTMNAQGIDNAALQSLKFNALTAVNGTLDVTGVTTLSDALVIEELSANPTASSDGQATLWLSDGTALGNDGDILYEQQYGSSTVDKGCLKWTDYTPTSYAIITSDGELVSGDVTGVQTMFDGTTLNIDEVAGTPGLNVEFVFSSVDKYPTFVVTRWQYDGSAAHDVTWDIYNYNTTSWDELRLYHDTEAHNSSMTMYIPQNINDDYVSGGAAKVRCYHHTAGTGGNQHHHIFDYVGLTHSLQGVI